MKSRDTDVSEDPELRELLRIHSPGEMADHLIGQYFAIDEDSPTTTACELGAELTVKTAQDALKWVAHWDVVARTLPEVSHLLWRNMSFGIEAAAKQESDGNLSKYFKLYQKCIDQTRTPLELWRATALEWTPAYFDERANKAPRRHLRSFLSGTKGRQPPPKEHPIWMALINRCFELTNRPDCIKDAKAYAGIVLPLYMGPEAYAAMIDLGLDVVSCIAACRPTETVELPVLMAPFESMSV